jgi:putative ATP-binding cassette transporter
MMAVGAFNQVHSSLRWFISNVGVIADWRATLMRVADFRLALLETEVLHGSETRIEFGESDAGKLRFDGLEIRSQEGCTRLAEPNVEIGAGERVLVTGEPGAGKTLFFRAVAGLWPWGGGRIGLPAKAELALVPYTPYFPPATLRETLGRPADGPEPTDAELGAVLEEAGIGYLSASLDLAPGQWEYDLSDNERRLLALAAIAVRRPAWVVVDEVLDTFDTATLKRVLAMFEKRLAGAAILAIGRALPDAGFFARVLVIVQDAAAPALKPLKVRAGAVEAPAAARTAGREKPAARRAP